LDSTIPTASGLIEIVLQHYFVGEQAKPAQAIHFEELGILQVEMTVGRHQEIIQGCFPVLKELFTVLKDSTIADDAGGRDMVFVTQFCLPALCLFL
jgi:hypothetical protein